MSLGKILFVLKLLSVAFSLSGCVYVPAEAPFDLSRYRSTEAPAVVPPVQTGGAAASQPAPDPFVVITESLSRIEATSDQRLSHIETRLTILETPTIASAVDDPVFGEIEKLSQRLDKLEHPPKPVAAAKPKYPAYPAHATSWRINGTLPGKDAMVAHLSSGEHRGRFDTSYLKAQSVEALWALHGDDHSGKVQWQYVVRGSVASAPAPSAKVYVQRGTSSCPNGNCPLDTTRRRFKSF